MTLVFCSNYMNDFITVANVSNIFFKHKTTKQSLYLVCFALTHKSKDNNKPNVKEIF